MKGISQGSPTERALDVYRTEGTVAVGRRALAKLQNILFRRNAALWFGRELVSSLPVGRSNVTGSFSSIAPGELARWMYDTKNLGWAADARELEVATECGQSWTNWQLGNEIVAFCKVGCRQVFVVDFERIVPLPEGMAFISDIYVLDRVRRRGIARELLIATMRVLKENSCSTVACQIPASNQPSLEFFGSLGFRSFGKIHFTRVLGLPIFSMKPEFLLERISRIGRHDYLQHAGS